MTDEQLQHLAMVAHHVYGSFDLVFRCIMMLSDRQRVKLSAATEYLQSAAAPA